MSRFAPVTPTHRHEFRAPRRFILPSALTVAVGRGVKHVLAEEGIDVLPMSSCGHLKGIADESTNLILIEVLDRRNVRAAIQVARTWSGWMPVFLARESLIDPELPALSAQYVMREPSDTSYRRLVPVVFASRFQCFTARIQDRIARTTSLPGVVRAALRAVVARRIPYLTRAVRHPGTSIQSIARTIRVSREYLSRRAREAGTPLRRFAEAWRTVQAVRLVREEHAPWDVVAWRCGYATHSGLSNLFHRTWGLRLTDSSQLDWLAMAQTALGLVKLGAAADHNLKPSVTIPNVS